VRYDLLKGIYVVVLNHISYFTKCTKSFENVISVSRIEPKQWRKTVILTHLQFLEALKYFTEVKVTI